MTVELIYVSKATARMQERELETLLSKSRDSNARLDITGLLLYDGFGTFIQVIEGQEIAINSLFQKIERDARHRHIHTLGRHHVTSRSFPDWRMGFRYINDSQKAHLDGYSDILNSSADSKKASSLQGITSFAEKLINHFKQSLPSTQ